jgi:type I restriction enzyme, S subunit
LNHWKSIKIEDIATKVGSGSTPRGGSDSYKESGTPLIRSMNIHFDGIHYEGLAYIDDEQADSLKNVEVFTDDVLLNITGASIGRVTQAPKEMNGARVNQHVCIIRPKQELNPTFLSKYLASPSVQRIIMSEEYGVTRQALTKQAILNFEIPLPPLNEQRRIVSTIEQLTDRSHKARAALEDVPKLIAQFRQSFLAAAFRGDLTADWREKNPDIEPASELLERIKIDRRKRWEKVELEKMKAKGKEPKDNKWKERYKESETVPELMPSIFPETWCFSFIEPFLSVERAGMKTGPFGSLLQKSDRQIQGIPVLGIENISENGFTPGNKIFITYEKALELSEYSAKSGDIIISRSGTVGEVCVIPDGIGEARISTNLIRLTLFNLGITPEYFSYLFKGSSFVLSQIKELCAGSTRDFLNQSIINSLIFPIPPVKEQSIIIEKINYFFDFIDKVELQMSTTFEDFNQLDRSILAKAFRGELVPQDPNDEPAAALLERIRAEREQTSTPKQRGKTTSKNSSKQLSINGIE